MSSGVPASGTRVGGQEVDVQLDDAIELGTQGGELGPGAAGRVTLRPTWHDRILDH
jgi:hypothetical protein